MYKKILFCKIFNARLKFNVYFKKMLVLKGNKTGLPMKGGMLVFSCDYKQGLI